MKSLIVLVLAVLSMAQPTFADTDHDLLKQDQLFSHARFSTSEKFPMNGKGMLAGVPRNKIYITIDDGPSLYTNEVLYYLFQYDVPATFFVLGQNAKKQKYLLKAMASSGHAIANHAYRHTSSNGTRLIKQIRNTEKVISRYRLPGHLKLYRAPGGAWSANRARVANEYPELLSYVGHIHWNAGGDLSPRGNKADWQCWAKRVSVKACGNSYLRQIRSNYRKGTASIVLLHDIKRKSALLLKYILKELRKDKVNWDFDLIQNIPAVQRKAGAGA